MHSTKELVKMLLAGKITSDEFHKQYAEAYTKERLEWMDSVLLAATIDKTFDGLPPIEPCV